MNVPVGPDGYFDESVAATYDEVAAAKRMYDPAVVEPALDFRIRATAAARAARNNGKRALSCRSPRPEGSIKDSIPSANCPLCKSSRNKKRRFAALL